MDYNKNKIPKLKKDLIKSVKQKYGARIKLLNPNENYHGFNINILSRILNKSLEITDPKVLDCLNFDSMLGHPSFYYTVILMSYFQGYDFEEEYGITIFDLTINQVKRISRNGSIESVIGIGKSARRPIYLDPLKREYTLSIKPEESSPFLYDSNKDTQNHPRKRKTRN